LHRQICSQDHHRQRSASWPCADENLFFIQDDGEESEEMVTGIELEALCRRMLKEARLADCGEAWSNGDEFEN
jgi:hypothetical protein